MLAMGVILSTNGGTRGTLARGRSKWGPWLSRRVSAPPWRPLQAPRTPGASAFPASALGVFKPAPGSSTAGIGCGVGRPSLPPPLLPPPLWIGCLRPGMVAPSVSNLGLHSAPSSGLCLGWGRLHRVPHSCPRTQREGSPFVPAPSPTPGTLCGGRGLCRPAQAGRDSLPLSRPPLFCVFGEPSAAASGIQPLHPLPWSRPAPGKGGGAE